MTRFIAVILTLAALITFVPFAEAGVLQEEQTAYFHQGDKVFPVKVGRYGQSVSIPKAMVKGKETQFLSSIGRRYTFDNVWYKEKGGRLVVERIQGEHLVVSEIMGEPMEFLEAVERAMNMTLGGKLLNK